EPLAIDDEVIVFGRKHALKCGDLAPRRWRKRLLAPATQRKRDRTMHADNKPYELREAFLDEPVDLRVGIFAPDVGDDRHVVDDIAKRRHAHDQYLWHTERKKKEKMAIAAVPHQCSPEGQRFYPARAGAGHASASRVGKSGIRRARPCIRTRCV